MNKSKRKIIPVVLYSSIHFLVDFAGIYFLIALVLPRIGSPGEWIYAVLLYNLLAFALPAVLGMIADLWNKNALFAALGCAAVLAAYYFRTHTETGIFLVGIGNGIFHLGGGLDILNLGTDKFYRSGVFISTGTIGVWMGTQTGKNFYPFWNPMMFLLGCSVIMLLMYFIRTQKEGKSQNQAFQFPYLDKDRRKAVFLLFSVVVLRSVFGNLNGFSWKEDGYWVFLFTLFTALGKAAGGYGADWLGEKKISMVSLGCSAVLAFAADSSAAAGCAMTLCFQMTMPVTLILLVRIFPQAKGWAFGILMLALFLGTLPFMKSPLISVSGWYLFGISMVSLIILQKAVRLLEKKETGE